MGHLSWLTSIFNPGLPITPHNPTLTQMPTSPVPYSLAYPFFTHFCLSMPCLRGCHVPVRPKRPPTTTPPPCSDRAHALRCRRQWPCAAILIVAPSLLFLNAIPHRATAPAPAQAAKLAIRTALGRPSALGPLPRLPL